MAVQRILLRTLGALAVLVVLAGCKAEDRARLVDLLEQLEASAGEGSSADPSTGPDTNAPAPVSPPLTDPVAYPTDALREGHIVEIHHIVDGDTLDVRVGDAVFKVRFKGASAPECHKAPTRVNGVSRLRCSEDDEYYGLASYEELVAILEGQTLRVECEGVGLGKPCERDTYDRWLVNLVIVGGPDVGEELLRRGAGFTSTSFRSQTRKKYCLAEYEARREGRGMWAGKTVEETLAGMNDGTQRWYRAHDARCDAAIREL